MYGLIKTNFETNSGFVADNAYLRITQTSYDLRQDQLLIVVDIWKDVEAFYVNKDQIGTTKVTIPGASTDPKLKDFQDNLYNYLKTQIFLGATDYVEESSTE